MGRTRLRLAAVATALLFGGVLSGCGAGDSGDDGGGSEGGAQTVKVLMVNNPQMIDLQKLTADNFTKKTGIRVQFKTLPENDVRDTIAQDVANQAGQYDVISISNYEVPIFAKNGWITDLTKYEREDAAFRADDLLPSMRESLKFEGKTYGEPFYGESSMLMYRKDLFEKAGIEMPERPTWEQVEQYAEKLDGSEKGLSGICLRGLPGWGEVMAPLTTVVNTFGGAWFDKEWNAGVNGPEFKRATDFYVNLVRKYGQSGAAQSGFTECLNSFSQGKTAMWYDATSAEGSVENGDDSKVKGKVGYAYAPVEKTKASGWLYAWAWGLEETSKVKDAAWKFISFASGPEYEKVVGETLGWGRVPDGKRISTYENPEYQKAKKASFEVIKTSIEQADPANPGVQPRPTLGIQFVTIPEFTKLGTDVSQGVSAAIAGKGSVDEALESGQEAAEKVAEDYKE